MWTKEQFAMMERLEQGMHWNWFQDSSADEILHFLFGLGIAAARVDKDEDWIELTEKGKAELKAMRKQKAAQAEQEAKEQRAEAKRLKERHEDYANAERRYHGQNKVTMIAALLSFFLGLLAEHFTGVSDIVFGWLGLN